MRLYNLLLRLYPASFRNEYAAEMGPLFARRRREATGLGVAGLWLIAIGDTLVNAAGAHVDILKQDICTACACSVARRDSRPRQC